MSNTNVSSTGPDRAGVVAPPPALYGAGVLAGLALHAVWPLALGHGGLARAIGIALIGIGVTSIVLAERAFRRHATSINPYKPTTALIESGPFARSRNPVYVGLTAIQLGIAFALGNAWIALMLVPVLVVMRRGVIAREERYLARKFGEEYAGYCARVRRWL